MLRALAPLATAALLLAVPARALAHWIALEPAVPAGEPVSVERIGGGADHVDWRLTIPGLDVRDGEGTLDGYAVLEIPGEGTLSTVGAPALPTVARWIAAEPGATVELLAADWQPLPLLSPVAPVQPPRYRDDRPSPAFTIDEDAYRELAALPAAPAVLDGFGRIRAQGIARLALQPVRYAPARGQLEVARTLEVRVRQPVPVATLVSAEGPTFDRLLERWLLDHPRQRPTGPAVPETMLIVVADAFADAIGPLVQWKTRRGLTVQVKLASEAGTTPQQLKATIQEAYATADPPLTYVLLVGDETGVPVFSVDASDYDGRGESDFIYTQLAGDDMQPDVLIGRLAGATEDHVRVQVNRIVRYERDVGRSDPDGWLTGVTGIASSGQGAYDPDWVRMERVIGAFEDYGYDQTDRFLEGQWHPADPGEIVDAVNDGRGWVTFLGHGSGVGWHFDSDWQFAFEVHHIQQLSNTGMWPVVMDVACSNGDFTSFQPCFAEAWVQAGSTDAPTGAAAIFSSTIPAAWDEPAEMEEGVVYAFLDDRHAVWGEALLGGLLHMQAFFGQTSTTDEVALTFVNFGDPSLLVRSRVPTAPQVDHDVELFPDDGGLSLSVTDAAGAPLADAVVALSDGDTLVAVARTDGAGEAWVELELAVGDTFDVVVTGFDLVTYEGQVEVVEPPSGDDDDDDDVSALTDDDDDPPLLIGGSCECHTADGTRRPRGVALAALLLAAAIVAVRRGAAHRR